MPISFSQSGSFRHIEAFLTRAQRLDIRGALEPLAQQGVDALRAATPRDTGLTAESWYYEITSDSGSVTIRWLNRDNENGFPVAVMLQYGYATGTGGYVQGRDYINPALRPIFDRISDAVGRVVTAA